MEKGIEKKQRAMYNKQDNMCRLMAERRSSNEPIDLCNRGIFY